MTRKPLIFSYVCFAALALFTIFIWVTLPDLEKYPLHWDANGNPDGHGSKRGVFLTLLLFPLSLIGLTSLFYFMPKMEPLRENLEKSETAYETIWILSIGFMTAVGALVAYAITSEKGAQLGSSPRLVVIGLSLLFIGIGNVLGKVRQNFMMGIRTPWTLTSELSWEKTHRVGSRVFVFGGLLTLFAALITAKHAFLIFNIYIAVTIAFCLIYSFLIWKKDPNKRKT